MRTVPDTVGEGPGQRAFVGVESLHVETGVKVLGIHAPQHAFLITGRAQGVADHLGARIGAAVKGPVARRQFARGVGAVMTTVDHVVHVDAVDHQLDGDGPLSGAAFAGGQVHVRLDVPHAVFSADACFGDQEEAVGCDFPAGQVHGQLPVDFDHAVGVVVGPGNDLHAVQGDGLPGRIEDLHELRGVLAGDGVPGLDGGNDQVAGGQRTQLGEGRRHVHVPGHRSGFRDCCCRLRSPDQAVNSQPGSGTAVSSTIDPRSYAG